MVSANPSLSHPGRAGGDWRLVGPWYRWEHPGLPLDGRGAAPAIQKFAGDDFIEGFLAHPQHSLKYDPVVDVVQTQDLVKVPGATLRSLMLALNAKGQVASKADESAGLYRARIAPGSLRKLYQPTHDRHYLVTCELHCDAPGFPRVKRDHVCQAGFVVRRRRSVVPAHVTAADIEAHTVPVRSAEAELMELRQLDAAGVDPQSSAGLKLNVQARQADLAHKAGYANWGTYLTAKAQAVANLRQGLNAWYEANKIAVKVDGWFPTLVNGRPSATLANGAS